MEIVFTTVYYLPHLGGVEVYIDTIAKYMIGIGYEATVIVTDLSINSVSYDEINGVRVVRIPSRKIGGFFYLKDKKNIDTINKEIENADIVHVNAPKFLYGYFAKKKAEYGYRLIASSHGWFYHTKKFRAIKDFYFKNTIVKYADYYDGIINVSYQDLEIAKSFGLKKSIVIQNGVDIYKYANLPAKELFTNTFVYWGRISRNKGIMECLKKLNSYQGNFTFNLIGNCGDEKYKAELDEYITSHEMKNKVHFLGRKTDEEIKQYLADADMILMPSLHEGFGMTLAECLLSGRPIIANTNDSFKVILHSVNADEYLFDYENPSTDFRKKVEELKSAQIELKNVEQYSTEQMIKNTLSVYGVS